MLRVKPVVATQEGDSVRITERPFLTEWTDMCLESVALEYTPARLGYREYKKNPLACTVFFARPLLLWLVLVAWQGLIRFYWRSLRWLFRHGVFHLVGQEGTPFRWRDVRPGPRRRARA